MAGKNKTTGKAFCRNGAMGVRVICFSICIFLSSTLFAQNTGPFPDDREGFLKAIVQLFNDTKRDDCKETAKQLEDAWPLINSSMQGDIIELAQAMRARKMLTTPYFVKYFNTVIAFHQYKISLDIWDDWKTVSAVVIANIKQGNNKKYEDYLNFSLALFTKHALSVNEMKSWKFEADVYDLVIENDVPVLKFIDGTIIGITAGDSIRIDQTSGTYYPLENVWRGTKGKANFVRVGYGEDDAYVTFKDYTINMDQSNYSVDTAKLYYDVYKKSNVLGTFSDKLLSHVNVEFATYPRFSSFKKDLLFEGVAPYVKMYGGLELVGAKMNLYGTPEFPCVIKIYRFDNLLGIIAKSQHFDIRKDKEINAAQAEIKLMLGKDSILHGGLTLRYNIEKRELFLFRGKNGIEKSAFNDYYHGYEMSPELIYWDMKETEALVRNIATQGQSTMVLESFDYYRKGKADKYTGLADYNMIDKMKQISDRTGEKQFYTEDLAKKIDPKYSTVTIQPILYKLVEDGFIDYDDKNELVTLRYKLFKYVAAKEKKVDYDNIRIESVSDSLNGIIDMRSYNFTINGVRKIVLSDTNFVVVFPSQNNVVLRKDRDFDFNGSMFAGRLDMSGKGFSFDYNDFKIDLSTVDSVVINIPTGKRDANGQQAVGPISSVISNVTGNLQIDTKDNRSGLKKHPQYPSLTTTQPSYVFYDNRKTFGGVYNRNEFYFELEPFLFDSLNTYNWQKIAFKGKLVSDGIFPDIPNTVVIQKDFSLGFKATKKDIEMYGGKGTFTNEITLDNNGLRGKGEIKFVGSVTKSRDIVFFPDSTLARADTFRMNAGEIAGIEFPTVRGLRDIVRWIPNEDSMMIKMDTIPFRMFDLKTEFRGTLVLQSKGLRGSGFVDWADAELSSNDIEFGKNRLNADSCDFIIKSLDPKKFALKTQDVNATIDFDKRVGDFKSNNDEISTTFPYNQYSTSINEFKWEMDKKRMTFKAPPGSTADFTSIAPGQDSLTFQGGNATYDMVNYILKVNKVPNIDVVDSRIIPDSGKVIIEAEAKMRTLNRAKLIMDSITEYHRLDSVTANIYGKNSLKASGIYSFTNKTEKVQKVFCDDIGAYKDTADKQLHVYAKATIDTSQKFQILPKIFYKGKMNVSSAREPVEFKGYAKLDIKNPKVKAEWFSINNVMTKDSNYIYYKDPVNEARRDMTAGLVFDADSSDLYTSFFNAKKSSRDKNLFVANGVVCYDDTTKEFIAGDADKIMNDAPRGNVLRYNDKTGKVVAEGKMNMGFNYGMVDMQSAGTVTYDVNKQDPVFELALGINFEMDDDLLAFMSNSVLKGNGDGDNADYTSEEFQKAITEFLDTKSEKNFREGMNKTGNFVKSDAMPYTIFFSNVKLKWDKTTKAFYNIEPFSLAYINKQSIATVIDGYIEMGFKRSGDYFNIYFPAGDEDFYFFMNYAAGNMQIVAGEKDFNQNLLDIKPEKRRYESKDGKTYMINPGSENKKNTFVNRIKFLQSEQKPVPKKK